MAIEWSDDLLVGNSIIDHQHQEIFNRFNAFLDACKMGKGRDALLKMLQFLGEYVGQHFATEEKLMKEIDYPDAESHKKEHNDLSSLVSYLLAEASKDGATLGLITETNQKLLAWLLGHIRKSDKALASYANSTWGLL